MRSYNGNVDPLSHTTVVDVADVRSPLILLHFRRMLLDMNGTVENIRQHTRQSIPESVVSLHHVAAQSAHERVRAERV